MLRNKTHIKMCLHLSSIVPELNTMESGPVGLGLTLVSQWLLPELPKGCW